jgi:hypothetical protein
MTPNDSVPQHTSAAACAACSTSRTELTMETFKNWTLRDRQAVVPLSKLERAKGRIRLTTKTVIHLALMVRLTELGLKPSEAARIADVFTHTGSGGLEVRREPGTLFPNGKTLLIVRPGSHTRVLNVEPRHATADKILGLCLGGIALDVNAVDAEVRSKLAAKEETLKQKTKHARGKQPEAA